MARNSSSSRAHGELVLESWSHDSASRHVEGKETSKLVLDCKDSVVLVVDYSRKQFIQDCDAGQLERLIEEYGCP